MICDYVEAEDTRPVALAKKSDVELLAIGEEIADTYLVLGILGRGAMACVYEAYDTELERAVAIKVAWPHVEPRHLRAEAHTLAALRHPSLVTAHGMGTHRGIPYLVMERLTGQTLAHYLRGYAGHRAGSVETILDILLAIAETLQYLHAHSVIHRDLKPSNIMLTDDGRVVLMDFGLQADTEEDRARVRGTPHYLAPEAVMDPEHSASSALDIYALGIIAFEMLTGRPPFDGRHPIEILRKQVAAALPTIDQHCRDLSKHLCHLLSEMLVKDPRQRLSEAGEVALWLRALLRSMQRRKRDETFSVLIADDDADMVGLLSACVEFAVPHARIRTVMDGAQAWAMFEVEMPDVLIVDIDMPRMGGLELCQLLQHVERLDAMTVLPVSGRLDHRVDQELAQLGIASPIPKRQNCHDFLAQLSEQLVSAAEQRNGAPDAIECARE